MKDSTNEVCKLLQKRAKLGENKYGHRLSPFVSERDFLWDAIEEAADKLCYLYTYWLENQEMDRINKKIIKIRSKVKKPIRVDDEFPSV